MKRAGRPQLLEVPHLLNHEKYVPLPLYHPYQPHYFHYLFYLPALPLDPFPTSTTILIPPLLTTNSANDILSLRFDFPHLPHQIILNQIVILHKKHIYNGIPMSQKINIPNILTTVEYIFLQLE